MTDDRLYEGVSARTIEDLRKFAQEYRDYLITFCAVLASLLTILNVVFGVHFTPYGDAILNIITSNSFLSLMLIFLLMFQASLYSKVDRVVAYVEYRSRQKEREASDETREIRSDGGLPPRDDEGKFVSKSDRGPNLLIVALAGMAGYLIAAETGIIDPIAGALLGIIVGLLYNP